MKRADSLLAPIIKNLRIEDAVKLACIKKEWTGIVKEPLSFHMSPAVLKEGELLINVDSPMWLQQINFYKMHLSEKLKGFGVKGIRLKIGRISYAEEKDKKISRKHLLSAGERAYIEETISLIQDSELKAKITKAMGKSITFKRN